MIKNAEIESVVMKHVCASAIYLLNCVYLFVYLFIYFDFTAPICYIHTPQGVEMVLGMI